MTEHFIVMLLTISDYKIEINVILLPDRETIMCCKLPKHTYHADKNAFYKGTHR